MGLYEQSRVFADGVEVGEVTSIDVQPDRVLVELHIDDIAIKADTEAILRLRSLIGERYVELTDVWTGEGRSEEHTSELQSLMRISYAVICLKQQTICIKLI